MGSGPGKAGSSGRAGLCCSCRRISEKKSWRGVESCCLVAAFGVRCSDRSVARRVGVGGGGMGLAPCRLMRVLVGGDVRELRLAQHGFERTGTRAGMSGNPFLSSFSRGVPWSHASGACIESWVQMTHGLCGVLTSKGFRRVRGGDPRGTGIPSWSGELAGVRPHSR